MVQAIPDEQVVRNVLRKQGRDGLLRASVEDAWLRLKGGVPDRAWFRRKSTLRALMWEYSVDNAIGALANLPGVELSERNDTVSFIFDHLVFLRFKKASPDLRSSNYPTPLALQYHSHAADLFGHPGSQRVEVVHVLNVLETDLQFVGVVARWNQRVLWSFELPQSSVRAVFSTSRPPASPTSPASSIVQPKKRARPTSKKS